MKNLKLKLIFAFLFASVVILQYQCTPSQDKKAEAATMTPAEQVEAGRYLVNAGHCNDCHTPKMFTEKGPVLDETLILSGHKQDEALPGIDAAQIAPGMWYLGSSGLTAWVGPWGISYSANLTPDSATGIGTWTEDFFIKVLRSGKFMGVEQGRPIMPPMPWEEISAMKDQDLKSIYAYLKTLRPIRNSVPAYVPPNEIIFAKK
ncbi:MAG: diheme cytochrome c-553 [Bacteroidia bacterium]|nr:diheme cytochrome c-553 [Bacteroidia bacterium]